MLHQNGIAHTTAHNIADSTAAKPSVPKIASQKIIKVFVLLGQSNMVGMGNVQGEHTDGSLEHAVKTKNRYQYLVDDFRAWKEVIDPHVRNFFTMGSGINNGDVKKDELLTVQNTRTIGPEIGIGCILGHWLASEGSDGDIGENDGDSDSDDILLLKSCIGNRSLGWDLLPQGSSSFDYTDEKTGSMRGIKNLQDVGKQGLILYQMIPGMLGSSTMVIYIEPRGCWQISRDISRVQRVQRHTKLQGSSTGKVIKIVTIWHTRVVTSRI